MAKYDGYQARLETMVTELQTDWPAELAGVPDAAAIARRLHEQPEVAADIRYDRQHTGFARVIVVTADDLTRLGVPLPAVAQSAAAQSATPQPATEEPAP